MLLERGADPDCLDKFHRTPLFWAAMECNHPPKFT